jgi:RND family efflux transporter MFP subunit
MSRYLLVLLCAFLALAGCESKDTSEVSSTQLVRVVEIRDGRLRHLLSFHGVLLPVTRARLAFQSPGVVNTRPAQLGQEVRKGELLATLKNPELGPAQRSAAARLQESLARRDQAKRDLARLQSLSRTGAVGEEQVEQKAAELASLQASVSRAEADLASTRQRLEDAALIAPFDGVISIVSVEPGEFVSAGQEVMAIGGMDKVEARILLPASLVGGLEIGDPLAVRVPQLGGNEHTGVVTELASIGEAATGLFPVTVEISVSPVNSMVRAGMQAEVLLDNADVRGLIVPLRAVVDPVGGAPKIFVIDGERVREVAVEILATANGEVAFESLGPPVDGGNLVVVAGHHSLTDGQPVRFMQ